jgi:hypothetical protein
MYFQDGLVSFVGDSGFPASTGDLSRPDVDVP